MMMEDKLPGRRAMKQQLLMLLEKDHPENIVDFSEKFPDHLVLNTLFGALCSPLEIVRWNAVICFGMVVPSLALQNMEKARVIMRRFLWSLNDESGGIGWGAPEALAEIMCHSKELRHEYLHMLVSYMTEDGDEQFQDGNYLELPMLQRGLLWGVGRLCQSHGREMADCKIVDRIASYLSSQDKTVAGLAIWCLGFLRAETAASGIVSFKGCRGKIQIYRDSSLHYVEIGFLAEEALLAMNGQAVHRE